MENLELHLGGTAIEKLPWSIQHLKHLNKLMLNGCENLATLAETTCNLRSLGQISLQNRSKLLKLPESLRSLQFVEGLCFPLASLSCLHFLKELDVSGCHLMEEKIPSSIWCLYLLEVLNLSINSIRRLPAGVAQLYKLKLLKLSHCKMLEEISMLPSSLRTVEAHGCPCLRTLWSPTSRIPYSLYSCFESTSQVYTFPDSIELFLTFGNVKGFSLNFHNIEREKEKASKRKQGKSAEEIPQHVL